MWPRQKYTSTVRRRCTSTQTPTQRPLLLHWRPLFHLFEWKTFSVTPKTFTRLLHRSQKSIHCSVKKTHHISVNQVHSLCIASIFFSPSNHLIQGLTISPLPSTSDLYIILDSQTYSQDIKHHPHCFFTHPHFQDILRPCNFTETI